MAVVLKPFDYASDGFTVEHLNEGDERDFGAATDGLVAEGFVSEGDVDLDGETPVSPLKKRGK
ncbi:hypothetical protein EHH54_31750 [Rhizobium leguminosarum]|uniref:hypothetical protein n=1 Tax=Rhizobium leguminosarum TaxID=384 RepID=UPI000FEC2F9C|nr:hypothetical protein [Rhizobium leguminosarum]RWX28951.1 hypothetical protein EHH54_31750 [Rhizobium leguminosarum]